MRTAAYAYTASFLGTLHTGAPLHLVDESLFDARADLKEVRNLAYAAASVTVRKRMLNLVLREWGVGLSGPANTSRWARAEDLRRRTKFRHNWWK